MFLFLPVAAAACVSLNFVSQTKKRVDSHADFLLLVLLFFFFVFVFVFFFFAHLAYLTYNVMSPDHVNRQSLILAIMCLAMINEHLQKSKLSAWLKIALKKSVASI